jgi:acyl carrier protein
MREIEIRVKQTVAEKLGVDAESVLNHKSFIDLGIQSTKISELLKELEQEFQMRITEEVVQPNTTVQSLVDFTKCHANVRI